MHFENDAAITGLGVVLNRRRHILQSCILSIPFKICLVFDSYYLFIFLNPKFQQRANVASKTSVIYNSADKIFIKECVALHISSKFSIKRQIYKKSLN